ncbi:MAG: Smr/MutS family protein [Burkholderiales bacterium]|jgi:DNA-nicking Smr family endonuclease|nr:Smr/MutS family protein [Burkholderiales bacterium]
MRRDRRGEVDPEDVELFREAVRDAVPLAASAVRVTHHHPMPAVPVQSLLDEHDALAESLSRPLDAEDALATGEEENFVRPGVPGHVLRRLRRGQWVVQGVLDLHGMTRVEAREALARFLKECVRRGARCVRIVHGKGLGSKNREPVLKGKVRAWLALREEVLAFCQAPPTQGGGGAVLVLLRG